jgi:hypothetical protein
MWAEITSVDVASPFLIAAAVSTADHCQIGVFVTIFLPSILDDR